MSAWPRAYTPSVRRGSREHFPSGLTFSSRRLAAGDSVLLPAARSDRVTAFNWPAGSAPACTRPPDFRQCAAVLRLGAKRSHYREEASSEDSGSPLAGSMSFSHRPPPTPANLRCLARTGDSSRSHHEGLECRCHRSFAGQRSAAITARSCVRTTAEKGAIARRCAEGRPFLSAVRCGRHPRSLR